MLAPACLWIPMTDLAHRLALHTWSIDTTPLGEALSAARAGGFDAMELRRIDFTRCHDAGMANEQVLEMVKASGMKIAVLGTEYGLLFADGDERRAERGARRRKHARRGRPRVGDAHARARQRVARVGHVQGAW
jgi:sugar phosphate isomerase/epimerase